MSPELIVRHAQPSDLADITKLQANVFGPGRFARSAYRIREGAPKLSQFCQVAHLGTKLVGALSFTSISIGSTQGALLLGPIVVDPREGKNGIGAALVTSALKTTQSARIKLVVLIGDEPYFARFGFKHVPPGQITFPGPVDPQRILAKENKPDALKSFKGQIKASPQGDA